ncbi:MAG TPA: VWA domain-containing protein [Sporichthyaceae bacterium]|nr:VWA domain-containing protein [Sporichthyaceae bacterium]
MSDNAVGDEFIAALGGFCRELRAEGLRLGTHDVMTLCETMGPLDPTDMVDLYWGGRTCLVHRREDIATYHEVFRRYFLSGHNPVARLVKVRAHADAPREESVVAFEVPATDPPHEDERPDETALGLMASNVATLRSKSFSDCTFAEREALRRIMRRVRLRPPLRRTRRTRPGLRGAQPDLRRTVRGALRTQGELVHLSWRARRVRARPVVLILDISGSMADHSRGLLQFAWGTRRVNQRVEVFAFGTRLTHLTKALNTRSLDDAMNRAAREVLDWEGGTRIGAAITEFVARWGRRGMARGAIVVICSDGFDRGDPETLSDGMERLGRLAHRVVWLTPHAASGRAFEPTSLGMIVAAPHVDVFGSCHDLAGLEEFAALLPTLA